MLFPEAFMNSRISGNSNFLARSIIIWDKYGRCFSLPSATYQANYCFHWKLVVTQEPCSAPPLRDWNLNREEAKGKSYVLLLPLSRNPGGHGLRTGPLAGGMWWNQERRKKTELLTKLLLAKGEQGRAGNEEYQRQGSDTQSITLYTDSGMLPGSSCSGMLKVCTEQTLSKPRSMNAFCFMSMWEEGCSWGHGSIEKKEQSSSPMRLAVL